MMGCGVRQFAAKFDYVQRMEQEGGEMMDFDVDVEANDFFDGMDE